MSSGNWQPFCLGLNVWSPHFSKSHNRQPIVARDGEIWRALWVESLIYVLIYVLPACIFIVLQAVSCYMWPCNNQARLYKIVPGLLHLQISRINYLTEVLLFIFRVEISGYHRHVQFHISFHSHVLGTYRRRGCRGSLRPNDAKRRRR